MKKILLAVTLLCLVLAFASCDGDAATSADTSVTTAPTTTVAGVTTTTPTTTVANVTTTAPTTETPETTPAVSGVDKETWGTILADPNFENYTLFTEGAMTVTVEGNVVAVSNIKEKICVTKDKVAIFMYAEDEETDASDTEAIVLDGDMAQAQKTQYTQLFMAMLENRDNFTFDAQTGTYKIGKEVSLDIVLKGLRMLEDGTIEEFDVPSTVVMRDGEVTLSDDGKLLKFVCDYSQTMTLGETPGTASGITTWTFSDYGTTVVE